MSKKVKLAIIGAGGHGKVVSDIALSSNDWQEIVFIDDDYPKINSCVDFSVIGAIKDLINLKKDISNVIVAIGDNIKRIEILDKVQALGLDVINLIHKSSSISSKVNLDKGIMVCPLAVININAAIKRGCIINSGAIVEHDCILEEGVHIAPNVTIAGNVKIGAKSWIGLNATILPNLTIGENSIVGAGAVVCKNVPDNTTVVGIPAKPKK